MTISIKSSSFRKDINGLRAWAVVSVICYHFGILGFNGGFVGVDIFFVISGFLMTGIIINGIEKTGTSQFSLLQFYLARARRIIPALLVLCCILMVLGWFWLTAIDYKMLSTHVLSALGFLSNKRFWREAGYFDASSYDKWLLHTWSLSIEWQFYIILPVALLLLWKIRPNRQWIIAIMALVFSASLMRSIALSPVDGNSSFYLLPTRMWEMLAGGLVFLLADKIKLTDIKRKALELIGCLLLLYAIFFLSSADIWPGYLATVPVLGTALFLLANRSHSPLTATKIAQWLGNTSYSLYLWHWPFVVALHYAGLEKNLLAIGIALLLTLLLGYASYRWVENPIRINLNAISTKLSITCLIAAMLIVAVPTYIIKKQNGIPNNRLAKPIEILVAEAKNRNPREKECFVRGSTPVPECTYGGAKLGVIVIGDSHGAAVIRSIEKSLPSKQLHVLDWTLAGCPTIRGIKDKKNIDFSCDKFLEHALHSEKLLHNNVPIIIANRLSAEIEGGNEPEPSKYINKPYQARTAEFYQEITNGIITTACLLAKNHPVYMLRPIPEMKQNIPNTMTRKIIIFDQKVRGFISRNEYNVRHKKAMEAQDKAARQCGIKILDPLPYLCDDNFCYGDKNGLPIYYDDNHLNERGGQLLIPLFKEVFLK